MEWSKLKNMIILLLLALNLIFLVLVGGESYEFNRGKVRMKEETLALLAGQNIHIAEGAVPWEEQYQTLTLSRERDREQELRLAEMILGQVTSQQEGVTVQYSGTAGTVQFYQSGQWSIQLSPGTVALEGEGGSHAVEYLNKLGIPTQVKTVTQEGDTITVELWQCWQQEPLFSVSNKVLYQQGSLHSIHGLWLSGANPVAGDSRDGLSPETLLVRFMGAIKENSQEESYDIQRILPGYIHRTTGVSAQRVDLIPVWWIETRWREPIILNCLTGTIEQLHIVEFH